MFGRTPRLHGRAIAVVLVAGVVVAGCSTGGVSESGSRSDVADDDTADVADDADDGAADDGGDEADGGDAGDVEADGDGDSTGSEDVDAFDPAAIDWEEYSDAIDTATVSVPVDYSDPDGDRFELYVARFRALDPERRVGSLLVNPGGPGFGGSDMAFFAAQIFDRELLESFDIIGWDPRGTGASTPAIDCIDDYDPYFTEIDSTPETEEEHAALVATAEDFARQCVGANRDIIQHVGTNNSARDIDSIRRALGEDQMSYFGFSYGSELGGAWVTMFPDTVRAAVLDGASDPDADALESSLQQAAGFEASLSTFLARCSDDSSCAFHSDGDAEGAFDALMVELDESPIPGDPGRPRVNRDVATTAVVQAMYSQSFWPALERSLADARDGDGAGLLALHDSYYQRRPDGTYGNELEAFQAISCADTAERLSVAEVDAQAPLFHDIAPRLSPPDAVGGYFCTFFPASIDPRVDITGVGAGPVVVIGTTGDPATPFESTVRMAETLEDGRLVVVEADQHTGYGENDCVVDVVNRYLVALEPPESGIECR